MGSSERLTSDWSVYIVKCSDGTLYTGATNDVERRIAQHNSGKGAKYTRSRRPVTLVVHCLAGSMSDALKLEAFVKRQPREKKVGILDGKNLRESKMKLIRDLQKHCEQEISVAELLEVIDFAIKEGYKTEDLVICYDDQGCGLYELAPKVSELDHLTK